MGGEEFDRRWFILGGFAVLAVVIVGIIVISRSGGGDDSDSKTTAAKEKKSSEGPCEEVEAPEPREESLPKPKLTTKKGEKAEVTVATNCGSFVISLDTSEDPVIANSFAYLVEEGFYDELTFHRIVSEFVIQGGDPNGDGTGGAGYEVVEAPPKNTHYTLGTVAMAKTSTAAPGTAGSQFYIVTGPQGEALPPEYAVAGQVTKGLNVVKTIGELGGPEEKPTQPVVIDEMTIERG